MDKLPPNLMKIYLENVPTSSAQLRLQDLAMKPALLTTMYDLISLSKADLLELSKNRYFWDYIVEDICRRRIQNVQFNLNYETLTQIQRNRYGFHKEMILFGKYFRNVKIVACPNASRENQGFFLTIFNNDVGFGCSPQLRILSLDNFSNFDMLLDGYGTYDIDMGYVSTHTLVIRKCNFQIDHKNGVMFRFVNVQNIVLIDCTHKKKGGYIKKIEPKIQAELWKKLHNLRTISIFVEGNLQKYYENSRHNEDALPFDLNELTSILYRVYPNI